MPLLQPPVANPLLSAPNYAAEPTEFQPAPQNAASDFFRGLRSSLAGASANSAAVDYYQAQKRGDAEAARRHGLRAQQLLEEAASNAPSVQSLGDINDIGSGVRYAAGQLGGLPVGLASPVAGSIAGAALASRFGLRNPGLVAAGGALGATGAMSHDLRNAAAMQHFQANDQQDPNEILNQSAVQGVAQAAPFIAGPVAGLPGRLMGKAMLPAARSMGAAITREAALNAGLGAASEGIGQHFEGQWNPNRDKSHDEMRLWDSAAGNALASVPFAIPGHLADRVHQGGALAGDALKKYLPAALSKGAELAGEGVDAVRGAYDARPQSLDEAALAVGQGAAKVHKAAEGVATRLLNKDPDVATLLRPQNGLDVEGLQKDDAEKHAAAGKLLEQIAADPGKFPDGLRKAAEDYANGPRSRDSWAPFRDAVNDWKRGSTVDLGIKEFADEMAIKLGKGTVAAQKFVDDVKNVYKVERDEQGRQNAQRPLPDQRTKFNAPTDAPLPENVGGTWDGQEELPGFGRTDTGAGNPERQATREERVAQARKGAKPEAKPSEQSAGRPDDEFDSLHTDAIVPLMGIKDETANVARSRAVARMFRAWGEADYGMGKNGEVAYVPFQALTKMFDANPEGLLPALKQSHDLMKAQGLLKPEAEAAYKQVVGHIETNQGVEGQMSKLVEKNLLPTAKVSNIKAGDDHVATGRMLTDILRRGEFTDEEESWLNRQFGHNKENVLEAADKLLPKDKLIAALEDEDALNPNEVGESTKWHGYKGDEPYKAGEMRFTKPNEEGEMEYLGTHDQHADNKAAQLTAKNKTTVKRVGYADYIREKHAGNPDALIDAMIEATQRFGMNDRDLNKSHFMLKEEAAKDKGEAHDIHPDEFKTLQPGSAYNKWAESTKNGGLASEGKIWFERADGTKFATSAARIIRRMREAGNESRTSHGETDKRGLDKQHEQLMQGITSMLASGHYEGDKFVPALKGHIGFRTDVKQPIKWGAKNIPDELRMWGKPDDTFGKAKVEKRAAQMRETMERIDSEIQYVKNALADNSLSDRARGALESKLHWLELAKNSDGEAREAFFQRIEYEREERALRDEEGGAPQKAKLSDLELTSEERADQAAYIADALKKQSERVDATHVGKGSKPAGSTERRTTTRINAAGKEEQVGIKNAGDMRRSKWPARTVEPELETEEMHSAESARTHDEMTGEELHPRTTAVTAREYDANKKKVTVKTEVRPGMEVKGVTTPEDIKKSQYVLGILRKGIPAFNDMLKRASDAQKADIVYHLGQLAEVGKDNPIWGGNPPKDMDAFQARVQKALASVFPGKPKVEIQKNPVRFDKNGKVKADTADGLENTIKRHTEYLENPPDDYTPAEAQKRGQWAEKQLARVQAELDKLKGSDDYDRQDQLSDYKFALKRLVAKAKEMVEADAELENKFGPQYDAKYYADRAKVRGVVDAAEQRNAEQNFTVRHVHESDDDYGQPTARAEYTQHKSFEEGVKSISNSSAEFGARFVSEIHEGRRLREAKTGPQDGDAKYNAQGTFPAERTPPSKEEVEAFHADIARRFNGAVSSGLHEVLMGKNAKGKDIYLSGKWVEGAVHASMYAKNIGQVGAHESFHQFFANLKKTPEAAKVMGILEKAANSAPVLRQIERLLDGEREALAQIKQGAKNYMEERMAYMFQFHQAGLLKIGPETQTVFQKIADFFRKIAGVLNNDQKADAILRAFDKGRMPDGDAAARVLANNIEARENLYKAVGDAFRPATDAMSRLVNTSEMNLKRHGVEQYNEVLRLFKRSAGEHGAQGYLDAKDHKMKLHMNAAYKTIEGLQPKDLEVLAKYLHTGKQPKDAVLKGAYDRIVGKGGLMETMENYLREAGVKRWDDQANDGNGGWVPMGHIDRYYPRSLDTTMLVKDPAAFVADLLKHNGAELEGIAKGYNESARKVGATEDKFTAQNVAEALANRMIQGFGQKDVQETVSKVGMSPFMQAINKRELHWLAPEILEKYGEKDVAKTLTSYVAQAVKRAEYVRRFGLEGEKLQDLLENGYKANKAKLLAELGPNATKEQIDKVESRALKVAQGAARDVMALEGTLGHDISNGLRKFNNSVMVYENMRLLSTSLFSQFIDPMGVVVRGGTMGDAWDTFKRGLKEVVSSIKDDTHIKDKWGNIADEVGTTDAGSALAAFGQVYSSQYMGKLFRGMNDALFKYNGMEGFNRGMQVGATKAAINFIKRHVQNPNERSAEYLRELGLDPKQVKIDKDGHLDYTDPKIKEALHQWVNGSIMRPNSAQRPAWASDPHYMIFWHMKQFAYTFHDVIMKRAMHEYKTFGDMGPAGVLIAAYTPIMIASDAMKSVLLTGGEPTWMKAGLGSELEHGAMRAGLLGRYQPAGDIALTPGRSMLGIGGPLLEQLGQIADQSPGEALRNAMPGANLLNMWSGKNHIEVQGED